MNETDGVDLGSNGTFITWCYNKESEDCIYKILDKTIVNLNWIVAYPKV